jgi:hypothetical protein
MWSRTLIAVVAALAVTGAAVAAGTLIWFLPQEHGTYTGPGTPQTINGTCELTGYDAWCSQGFQVNSTAFNTTMCFTTDSTSAVAVEAYFMNSSSYHQFNVNSTLTKIGQSPEVGCTGPTTYSLGPGPFYWVWLDTTSRPIQVQYSVSVEAEG